MFSMTIITDEICKEENKRGKIGKIISNESTYFKAPRIKKKSDPHFAIYL